MMISFLKSTNSAAFLFGILLFAAFGCKKEIYTIHGLDGKDESQIIEKYGTPQRTKTFILTDTLYEYQQSLNEIFSDSTKKEILIKELFWEKDKKKIVAWLTKNERKWEVVDNLVWCGDHIQF